MLFVLVASLAIFAAQAGATNLLVNGSFQSGDFTGWTLGTTSNGTAGAGFPIIATWPVNNTGNAWEGEVGEVNFTNAPEGATLSQTFNSGAGAATVSIDWAALGGCCQNADGGQFYLLIDNAEVASYQVGTINPSQLLDGTLSANVNLSAGSHTFEVEVLRSYLSAAGTPFQYVTHADVEGTVPEPGSLILMGSGVLGLAGILRRRIGF